MNNRKSFSPILFVVALTFAVGSSLRAQTQAEITSSSTVIPPPTSTTSAAASAISIPVKATPAHTSAYTVVKGDTLTRIAEKFNTTRRKLAALNNLTVLKVKPGEVLLVPSSRKSHSATAANKGNPSQEYPMAQPVQDFDIPASTFASCPVPLPSPDDDAEAVPPATEEPHARIAQLVSPAEMAAESAKENAAFSETAPVPAPKPKEIPATKPQIAATVTMPNAPSEATVRENSVYSTKSASSAPLFKWNNHILNPFANSNSANTASANDWGSRFLQKARELGNEGIGYDEEWRPPGESHSWEMDCSNTSRYIYKVTAGINLPRTASDQYYYLHLQGKAWDVPQNSQGFADGQYLREHLKPGDLLFWENTYRPERQPPITHVMIYLGTNASGQWLMAGSQSSRGGEHNRRNGGPDVYIFRPSQPCGGYTTWLGLVHHQGRFCAYGRPLEADPSKFAENN